MMSIFTMVGSLPLFFWHALLFAGASNRPKGWSDEAGLFPWQTWGPYRPNLYFGVRPQIAETLLMGLMWASGDNQSRMLKTLRDTCEQDDDIQGYGWTLYDTRVGGSQTIHDKDLHIDLSTSFLKTEDGKSWTVHVTGTPRLDAPHDVRTTVIFHTAVEKADSNGPKTLTCTRRDEKLVTQKNAEATCYGEVSALGFFEFDVIGDSQNNVVHYASVKSLNVSEDKIWQAKSVFIDQIKTRDGNRDESPIIDDEPGAGNLHYIQMTFDGPFTLTFTYREPGGISLYHDEVRKGLDTLQSTFSVTMNKTFPRTSPFEHDKYTAFSQALLSNLFGGLGFFHGDSRVDYSHAPEYNETDLDFWEKAAAAMARAPITTTTPTSLISYTPSRPFFPRGFLWDEGFHLLPVIEWDLDLAITVLRSWLNLMDEDGWIAREQILGPEARSKVPEKFQIQYPHYANPPTLSLLFPVILSKLTGESAYYGHPSVYLSSPHRTSEVLSELYRLLSRHYRWFRRTQAGNFSAAYPRPDGTISGEGYRWRGRTPMHTLTSGLDDYPRANPPHPAELHIDALAWVGASAQALRQMAAYLGEDADTAVYEKHLAAVKHNLDVLHWDTVEQNYCDATIVDGSYARVCHQGYNSLFPFLLGLMDADHPNLPHVLNFISDPTKVLSPYGLRSLSALDPYYGTDENYWRGAVWMNLNVLAVLRLRDTALQGRIGGEKADPIQTTALSLATELRVRLINTVFNSWEQTGFFWEQYNDKTGEGSHGRAFTGWTAYVVLLMSLDLDGNSGNSRRRAGLGAGLGFYWMPTPGFLAFVGCVVSAVVFRRRLALLLSRAVNSWRVWLQNWEPGQG
ncbi:glycoside hydrolase family 63 protein [Hypoxylon sp. NC0597]|nr:glycoside hydrolase family 63 protein [Hypoxylon sp. NC0597]